MSTEPNAPPGGNDEGPVLSETDRHRLLSSERRRLAIDVLAEVRLPVSTWELAREIALAENDDDVVVPDTVDRVALALDQHHLPKMDDLDVVDYARDAKQVESHRLTRVQHPDGPRTHQ